MLIALELELNKNLLHRAWRSNINAYGVWSKRVNFKGFIKMFAVVRIIIEKRRNYLSFAYLQDPFMQNQRKINTNVRQKYCQLKVRI